MRRFVEVRSLMTLNDMTQPDVAKTLGISPSHLSRKMVGDRPFDLDEMYTILDLFQVPHERLHIVFPKNGLKN